VTFKRCVFAAMGSLACLFTSMSSIAQMGHDHTLIKAPCIEPSLICAPAATPAFAPDGTLFVAFSAGGLVLVTKSEDRGKSFSAPVRINAEAMRIDTGPDARPKIAVGPNGRITVAFAILKDDFYNGQVLYSVSSDGGLRFTEPKPIANNGAGQRFETLAIGPEGELFAAWLDKRNAVAARARGQSYAGAALVYAWAEEGGFSPAKIIADNSCECCRLAVAFAGARKPAIFFRNIFGNDIRDHAVLTFEDSERVGRLNRVGVDNWHIDGCPHQGPSFAISRRGIYHAAWFTNGDAHKGLFYARSLNGGEAFSDALPIGNPGTVRSRPFLLNSGDVVWLVWKEFNGKVTAIAAKTSADDGEHWSETREIAGTSGASDHPLLIAAGSQAYLSWLTANEGYRLFGLEAAH
jgi:hypothetical protein